MRAFRYPPNIYDSFVLFEQIEAEAKALQAETRAQQAEMRIQELARESAKYRSELHNVYMSTSWRMTKPLRWCIDQIRGERPQTVQAISKVSFKNAMLHGPFIDGKRQRLKSLAVSIATNLGLADWLRRFYLRKLSDSGKFRRKRIETPKEHSLMSPRAQTVYAALQQEIKKNKKGRN
jgi:hypothetical protein